MIEDKIKSIALKNNEKVIKIRRQIHSNPELAFKEFETSKLIKKELDKLNIEYIDVAGTGVLATIKGNNNGKKTMLLRADMDGLPIKEENDLEFKSTNDNMHACGHDAHVSWLLGAAMILNDIKEELHGNVKLLFQPGEEKGGSDIVIKENVLEGVDVLATGHCWPTIESGKIGIARNCAMAATNTFEITIIGKGGHGAEPHNCIDPIAVGNAVYTSIQQIVSRKIDPVVPVVVSICSFNSGISKNIIPDICILQGTIRAVSQEKVLEISEVLEHMVRNICKAHGADCKFEKSAGGDAVVNDKNMIELGRKSALKILGDENIEMIDFPAMTGEDFAIYMKERPGLFMYIGVGNKEKNINYRLHNNKFNIDEKCLSTASSLFAQLAVDYLCQF
ncbi:M20 family metallopeptidase [Clostridioides sp. ZZV14-6150]|uniref:M20 metallopeptidase family protein n=1 Tax=unclassified Clostridioides TaxID=2635829 RepID=UPI001D1170A4|nr:amidohydrolase [Clostridioides sp. ZZV14-6150]MCC0721675.1 amidohydrolase [Clostridioides sp. ZZV14-6104]MCC0750198.1 amidohydrolase [Clostridioides sp. ZZV13-5731]